MKPRLLGDENTSHKFVKACLRLSPQLALVRISEYNKNWCGLSDDDLLDACFDAGLILVTHDRSTIGLAAGGAIRERKGHAGIIVFRASIHQEDYGAQARALCGFWSKVHAREWFNRMAYVP